MNKELKAGMFVRHNCNTSPRFGANGVVISSTPDSGSKQVKYVVCWVNGGNLLPGQTSLQYYTSNWLRDNVIIIAEPVSDTPMPTAFDSQKAAEMANAAQAALKGPYLVNVVGSGGEPRKEHQSLTLAKAEASRLSKRGNRVQVLAVVATVKQKAITTYEEEWA